MKPLLLACILVCGSKIAAADDRVGVDGQVLMGSLVEASIAGRYEHELSGHHVIVATAHASTISWMDTEEDDPTFHGFGARAGYRYRLRHAYLGVDLGPTWIKATYPADAMPTDPPQWFRETSGVAIAGLKLGPVDLGFDVLAPIFDPGHRRIGIHLGLDAVRW